MAPPLGARAAPRRQPARLDLHRRPQPGIDSYRAGAARRAAEAALRSQAATQETTEAGPHRQAEARERLARLDTAIGRLPEEQRVILTMATAGELTSSQIGEALGEPAGTVRYRLSQARKQLAAALDLEEDGA